MKAYKPLIILLLLIPAILVGQEDQKSNSLVIIAKQEDGNTRIKFVPLDVKVWMESTQKGFQIERAQITANDTGDFQLLNEEAIFPASREEWDQLATEDSLATYARQMLYDEAQQSLPQSFAEKFDAAKRLERRHFFYLYFSTRSPMVSKKSGMEWLDETAEPGRKYIYRAYVRGHKGEERYQVEQIIQQNKVRDVPSPSVQSQGGEKTVNLRWVHEGYEQIFFSYDVERSKDGETFEVINEAPLVFNTNRETPRNIPGYMDYTDSVYVNYEPFYYRIVAYDYFGDAHEPSKAIKQMGRDRTPPVAPANIETSAKSNGIEVNWHHPGNEGDLAGFLVVYSDAGITGPYDRLHEVPLAKDARSYLDQEADLSAKNYYMVLAIDTANNYSSSLASYAFIPDTTPPAPPTGLQYEVDTNGVLQLQWDEGPEDDIKGYRVFRSVNKKFEQVLRSRLPVMAYNFIDTLPMKTLDEYYYYRVVAIDQNYNHSGYSEFLEVKKPDLVPPTTPLLTALKWEKDKMLLEFAPSSSDDVIGYKIFRRVAGEQDWTAIEEIGPNETGYVDVFEPEALDYEYCLKALDDDGHESEFSNVKQARVRFEGGIEPVNNVSAEPHPERGILVNWSYIGESPDKRFIIYRAVDEGNLTMYRSVAGNTFTFRDFDVNPGNIYNYAIKAQDQEGRKSALSTVATIELE